MKKWWKINKCYKCLLWIDMGEDDWDKYKGCVKQKNEIMKLKNAP